MVADFGVVSIHNHLTSSVTSYNCSIQQTGGTLRWMAPERLDGEPLEKSSDLYSFAITAWELYSRGEIPFSGVPDSALSRIVVDKGQRPSRPASLIRDNVWAIICICWQPDPKKRPLFSGVHQELKTISGQGDFLLNKTPCALSESPIDTHMKDGLADQELVRSLVKRILMAKPDSQITAAGCLSRLIMSGLFLWLGTFLAP
jgi:serine/threonine protein kinase